MFQQIKNKITSVYFVAKITITIVAAIIVFNVLRNPMSPNNNHVLTIGHILAGLLGIVFTIEKRKKGVISVIGYLFLTIVSFSIAAFIFFNLH